MYTSGRPVPERYDQDEYGGPVENRCRFLMEIVQAVAEADCHWPCRSKDLAYHPSRWTPVHIVSLGQESSEGPRVEARLPPCHLTSLRGRWERPGHRRRGGSADRGSILCAAGVLLERRGRKPSGTAMLIWSLTVAFFISNPDLVYQFKIDDPLNAYNRETYYTSR